MVAEELAPDVAAALQDECDLVLAEERESESLDSIIGEVMAGAALLTWDEYERLLALSNGSFHLTETN